MDTGTTTQSGPKNRSLIYSHSGLEVPSLSTILARRMPYVDDSLLGSPIMIIVLGVVSCLRCRHFIRDELKTPSLNNTIALMPHHHLMKSTTRKRRNKLAVMHIDNRHDEEIEVPMPQGGVSSLFRRRKQLDSENRRT